MNELVPTGARDLIFEPTESLSARIISAVEEKKDAEERMKELEHALRSERRKKNGANLRAMLLFGMVIAAAAAAFFIWNGAEGQVAKADAERAEAIEARDAAVVELQSAQQNNVAQLTVMDAFQEYQTIADSTIELRRMNEQLASYSESFRLQATPGLDREATLDVRSQEKDWLADVQAAVEADRNALESALAQFDEWTRSRLIEKPVVVRCLPKNPFRQRAAQPGCPN